MKAAVDLLQANPKIDGIYAMNDEMGMGVPCRHSAVPAGNKTSPW